MRGVFVVQSALELQHQPLHAPSVVVFDIMTFFRLTHRYWTGPSAWTCLPAGRSPWK
ncbi:MAG TPA: hypothetical protein VJO52_09585 [Gemmatimonadaceae bacterium]|nr:hypothetical protein [Gemmatimonadaceae bacterium]